MPSLVKYKFVPMRDFAAFLCVELTLEKKENILPNDSINQATLDHTMSVGDRAPIQQQSL